MKTSMLLALALLAIGSCASADTIYVSPSYPAPVMNPYVYPAYPSTVYRSYYYDNGPSVSGFVDRSAKTGIGLPGKAAKEAFKALF